MKETTWNDCLANYSAAKISPDKGRAQSLRETSKERLNCVREITKENCNFVFEDYYTSLLELLQSAVILAGYKVSNHVCLGFYFRDVLANEKFHRVFDDIRYKRNSLTYYGKRMDFETCKEAIENCKKLIKDINGLKIQ
ncbi:MAG TPA: hypothetical protein VJJ82_05390 [Candidatus Nanoarchaeia archaeon]|nr:hypothetical protein [Candidatus Nanoarchaeia archaeon]